MSFPLGSINKYFITFTINFKDYYPFLKENIGI